MRGIQRIDIEEILEYDEKISLGYINITTSRFQNINQACKYIKTTLENYDILKGDIHTILKFVIDHYDKAWQLFIAIKTSKDVCVTAYYD